MMFSAQGGWWTYRALVRILPGIADMVGRELDWLPVQRGQEGLCEGHLGHYGALEAAVQSVVFSKVRQVRYMLLFLAMGIGICVVL